MTLPPTASVNPPAFNAPRVVLWLIAAMVAVHLVRVLIPEGTDFALLRYLAFIPARFTSPGFSHYGGLPAALWSWLTYNFLHGGFGHLFVNSLWMLAFGSAVAWRIGARPFVVFSLMCGASGALVHLLFHWGEPSPMIGASAMISGHMAAAIRFVFRNRGGFGTLGRRAGAQDHVPLLTIGEVFEDRRSFAFLAVWALINLGIGLGGSALAGGSGIAWEAHIGGFAAGLLFFGYFDPPTPPQKSYYRVV